jgi:hypothetical protein
MSCLLYVAAWSVLTGLMASTGYFSLIGAAVVSFLALVAITITTK